VTEGPDEHRDLLPEEAAAGSDDAIAETAAILEESEERAETRLDPDAPVEHRHSDESDAAHVSAGEGAVRRRVALVAHDNKKTDLLDWADYNRGTLVRHDLIATGTTGRLLTERCGLTVTALLSGPLGGDQQLGASIAEGAVDVLIFFWDPLEPQPHDPDVKALLRIAAVWNVAVACNRATADYIISSPLFAARYDATLPDFARHAQRTLPIVPAAAEGASPQP
jgi:methylglyoxal synthase